MTAALFLAFLALIATVVVALVGLYLNRRIAFGVATGLAVWFMYAGLLGYFGVLKNTTRPPGIAFVLAPVIAFIILLVVRFSATRWAAAAFPIWLLLGMQCFRIGVELFLHQLWIDGLVPKMLTFEGANVDIYIGATAPVIAWLSTRGRSGLLLALIWNVLGLLALANVVIRAVLTSPGPLNMIHAEVPDQLISTFPFLFVPAFFVPLAVVLHVLAIRDIASRSFSGIERSSL
jgi:hypothetical protein